MQGWAAEGGERIGLNQAVSGIGVDVAEHQEGVLGQRPGYHRWSRYSVRRHRHVAAQAVELIEEWTLPVDGVEPRRRKDGQPAVIRGDLVRCERALGRSKRETLRRQAVTERRPGLVLYLGDLAWVARQHHRRYVVLSERLRTCHETSGAAAAERDQERRYADAPCCDPFYA